MNHQFEVNGIYEFEVISRVELPSGRKHFLLRYNGLEKYIVLIFPSQEIMTLPRTVKCRVKEIKPNGDVVLRQDKKSFYETLYKVGKEHPFARCQGSETETDQNEATFIHIEDEYGNQHRYYPANGEELPEGVFRLRIKEITDRDVRFFYRLGESEVTEKTVPEASVGLVTTGGKKPLDVLPEEIEENEYTEFKSSVVFPAGSTEPNIDLQLEVIVRTLAAFMNAKGGVLYIGINNKRVITGISCDLPYLNKSERDNTFTNYAEDRDGYELCIRNAVKMHLGHFANGKISMDFMKGENSKQTYLLIRVPSLHRPVFFKGTLLYQRAGNGNQLLRGDNITNYIEDRLRIKPSEVMYPEIQIVEAEESSVSLKPHERISIPHPVTIAPSAEQSKIWRYITWYKKGGWSYDTKPQADTSIIYQEVAVQQHEKQNGFLMLMCYANGCINAVSPASITSGNKRAKVYSNGYSRESELMSIILARPYDLIAVYSIGTDGQAMVKLHKAADFGMHKTIYAKGNIALHEKLGTVTGYQRIRGEIDHALSALIEPKVRTSSSAGVSLGSDAHIAEVDLLKTLPGYPIISNA